MALGTELMHHVRFTLDYPQRRSAGRARRDRVPSTEDRGAGWDIPLWTFSQACLAQGVGSGGRTARVLVDTGNRIGHVRLGSLGPAEFGPISAARRRALVFKFRHQGLTLDTMDLGSPRCSDWPIVDRMPADLERLDLVDVLVGP